jgi:two-component system sensor histidine kinase KdpD
MKLQLGATGAKGREWQKAILVLAVILPALIMVLVQLRQYFNLTTNTLLLLIVTVAIAVTSNLWLSILSAIESFLFLNYYFTPPFHTLTIGDKNDLVSLIAFMISSVSASLILNQLKIRTLRLKRMSEEGLFLSGLAREIIKGNQGIEVILENFKSSFGFQDLAIVKKVGAIPAIEIEILYGTIPEINDGIMNSEIKLSSEYSLLANPPITNSDLRNLVTTFGSQILILIEREIFEVNEKALSDIRQTDQMRVALLNAVSHDLRGPLASSKAAISSLMNTEIAWSGDDRKELLDSANHSLDLLNNLIENLLDMSRLEADAISLHTRAVDVEDAISGAVKALKTTEKRIEIAIDGELPLVKGDPILLERVLVNLMENALRFTPKDHLVRVQASDHMRNIEIRVIDRGPGINPKDYSKVFLPFQRLGDRDNTTGVGLGLAIVKGFTELMEGTVSIEQTPGGGLTVLVSLPIAFGIVHG